VKLTRLSREDIGTILNVSFWTKEGCGVKRRAANAPVDPRGSIIICQLNQPFAYPQNLIEDLSNLGSELGCSTQVPVGAQALELSGAFFMSVTST